MNMWTRSELKEKAKLSVKANYWKAVLVAFVLSLVSGSGGGSSNGGKETQEQMQEFFGNGGFGQFMAFLGIFLMIFFIALIIGIVISIFVCGPVEVGCRKYFVEASEGKADLSNMGFGFRNGYMNIALVMFLRNLFIGLWTLLLIVPGIYKAYQYYMIPYILGENPNMSFTEAKNLSAQMMDGHKWNTFVLDLSFILWDILGVITFGLVGIFWVGPYRAFTSAELYKTLCEKKNNEVHANYVEV